MHGNEVQFGLTNREKRPAPRLRWVVLASIFLAVACLVLLGRWSRAWHRAEQPIGGLVCEASRYDFGQLRPASAARAEHTFLLKNESARAARILRVKSTCGCTTALYENGAIPAHTVFPVRVEAKWTGRSGLQSAQVSLTTDDPGTPRIVLEITGNVLNGLAVSPAIINFGVIPLGSPAERIIDVGGPEDLGQTCILGVHTSNPMVSIERLTPQGFAPAAIAGPGGRFRVLVRAEKGGAELGGEVVFDTALPDTPRLTIAVTARVEPDVAVRPQSLFWPRSAVVEGASSQSVVVYCPRRHCDAAIVSNGKSVASFALGSKPWLYDAGHYTIPVMFDARPDSARFVFATLKLKVDDAFLDVPLTGICEDGTMNRN